MGVSITRLSQPLPRRRRRRLRQSRAGSGFFYLFRASRVQSILRLRLTASSFGEQINAGIFCCSPRFPLSSYPSVPGAFSIPEQSVSRQIVCSLLIELTEPGKRFCSLTGDVALSLLRFNLFQRHTR